MMPARARHLLILGVLLLALVGLSMPAKARVIGVVFDDSGSMVHNIHLPTFGAQLLAATLDGRDGKDRLFTARLSQLIKAYEDRSQKTAKGGYPLVLPAGTEGGNIGPETVDRLIRGGHVSLFDEQDIRTEGQLRETIGRMARDWPRNLRATPYEPVEIMLEVIARNTRPGEDAYLIVLTDGAFYDGDASLMPSPDALRANYERYKEKIQGSLSTFFVLTLNKPASELVPLVDSQAVRKTLLEVFNGNASRGSYEVHDFESLLETMLEIIASVSSSDLDREGSVVKAAGNEIALDFPFSVSRIISLSIAEEKEQLPVLEEHSFSVAERWDLRPEMREGDNKKGGSPGWPTTKLRGLVSQLRLSPPLPPGHYNMGYDAETRKVTLLFGTEVVIHWKIIDAAGDVVASNQQPEKAKALIQQATYRLEVELRDDATGGVGKIDLASLKSKKPELVLPTTLFDDAGGQAGLEMTIDREQGVASGVLRLPHAGDYSLISGMRLPGFNTVTTGPVTLAAIDPGAMIDISVEGMADCNDCRANELKVNLVPGQSETTIASVRVSVSSTRDGVLLLERGDDWPNGLKISDGSGGTPAEKTSLPFESNKPLRFALQATPEDLMSWMAEGSRSTRATLAARVAEPLRGAASKTVSLRINPLQASLVPTGNSRDPTGERPLTLSLEEAGRGQHAFHLFLRNALSQPTASMFEAESSSPFLSGRFEVSPPQDAGVDGYAVHFVPEAQWWCLCFLTSGQKGYFLSYEGPHGFQNATANLDLQIQSTWLERALSCLKVAVLLLVVLWLLLAVVNTFRTHRFPYRSRLSVVQSGHEFEKLERLRRRNWTFLKLLAWPFRLPHERRSLEGMTFVARPMGATLAVKRAWPGFSLVRLGKTLDEVARGQRSIEIIWNDVLEETDRNPTMLTLIRDYRNRAADRGRLRRRRRKP